MSKTVSPEDVQHILRDKNDDPVRLSHSTLECHKLCPRKGWYNKHEKLRRPSTERLKLGTDLHAFSEMYLAGRPLPTVSEEVNVEVDGDGFITERFEDEFQELDPQARPIFEFALSKGVLPEPGTVDTERWCEVEIFPGILFVGKVDYSKTDNLAPGELPIMGDHKTRGKVWSKWVKNEVQLCDDPQTLRYAYCLLHTNPVQRVQLEHINYQTDALDVRKVVAEWSDGKVGVPWSHVLDNWDETIEEGLDMARHWQGAEKAEDVKATGGRACWAFGSRCEYMRICEAAPKRATKEPRTIPAEEKAILAARELRRKKKMKKNDPYAALRAKRQAAIAEKPVPTTPEEVDPNDPFACLKRNQLRNKNKDPKPPEDHPVETVEPKPVSILPVDHPDIDHPSISVDEAVGLAVQFLEEEMEPVDVARALVTANFSGDTSAVLRQASEQVAQVSSPVRTREVQPSELKAQEATKPLVDVEEASGWGAVNPKVLPAVRAVFEALEGKDSLPDDKAKNVAKEAYKASGGARMSKSYWLSVISALEDVGIVQDGDEFMIEGDLVLPPKTDAPEQDPPTKTAAEGEPSEPNEDRFALLRAQAEAARARAESLKAPATPVPTTTTPTAEAPPRPEAESPVEAPKYLFTVYVSTRTTEGPSPTDFLQWAAPYIEVYEQERCDGNYYGLDPYNKYNVAADAIIQILAVATKKHRGSAWPHGLYIRRDNDLSRRFLDVVLSRLPVQYVEVAR